MSISEPEADLRCVQIIEKKKHQQFGDGEANRGATGRESSSSSQISAAAAAAEINVMVRLWMAEIGPRKTRRLRHRRTPDSLLLD
ncbi:hypothetical protein Q3G72_023055 [Acer saccharum]|nr:hypothetical protein Q3G72_023055 [Acer saccharum]